MSSRTLVITLGQLRAHQLTWDNFRENVLEQLGADLAVCVPDDDFFDFTNPFYANARYRWLVPTAPDLTDIFDRIQRQLGSSEDWRALCDVEGTWLGKIARSNQPGAGAISYVLRWFMLNHVRAARLTEIYDRFVVTRSDYFYLCPHPPLDCLDAEHIWLPDGEDFGGLCDRHLVVSARDLVASCDVIDDLLQRPREIRKAMVQAAPWNVEKVLAYHFQRRGLLSRVRRFPYVMLLVRGPDDPTAWSTGTYVREVGMVLKMPQELREAGRYRYLIRSTEDWQRYFAARYFKDLLPAHIHTQYGTVLYVDQTTHELRHGALPSVPCNAYLVSLMLHYRIMHFADGRPYDTLYLADHSESGCGRSPGDGSFRAPFKFKRIAISDKLVGLRHKETYLCAEADGRIVLNRPRCEAGAQFWLTPVLRPETILQSGRSPG